jgi:uncharacterized phage protein gp47/JayE
MYGQHNYDAIINRMLSRVQKAAPELDTREGSLIHAALAPAAAEIQLMYIELDTVLRETFADTACLPFLTRRAAERGIIAKEGETEEQLRRRYIQSLSGQPFGGNIADYIQKAGALPGVGGVKVEPAWQGPGTVRLVITGGDMLNPDEALLAAVRQAIDPAPGQGRGIAPIGHTVTVQGAALLHIDISFKLAFQPGYSYEMVAGPVSEAAGGYFEELRRVWPAADRLVVRASALEQRFLSLPGVADVNDLRLNNSPGNIILLPNQLPVTRSFTNV